MNTTSTLPIYDSAKRGNLPLEELREAWRFRHLIVQFIRRDITARYKRSILGIAWTMLNPLGMMLVKVIVFSAIWGRDPLYPVYVLSGLIAFNFFQDSTMTTIRNLVWGGGLMTRVYIPRSVFAISAVGASIVNFAIAIIPLLAIALIVGSPLNWTLLFMPVAAIILAMFSLGMGLLLSISSVYFPDIAEMYSVFLKAWIYLTPIIYPERILPDQVLLWIKRINPLYYYVNIFRYPVYEGRLPTFGEVWPALVVAIVILIVGWVIFSWRSDEFVYRN